MEDQDRKVQWVNFAGTGPMWALGHSALFIVCLASSLTSFFLYLFFLAYLLPYLPFPLRIGLLSFQARGRKRRPHLGF